MAQYADLKAAINAAIKQNNNQEITGPILNGVLNAMVNSLGANYQLAGVATPSTNPGTPDQNVFYFAFEAGIYTNFSSIELPAGISMLRWNGSWTSQTWYIIDSEPIAGSNNLVKSSSIYSSLANIVKSELNTARENVPLNNIGIVKDGVIDTTNTSFKYSDYIDVDSLVFYVKYYAQGAYSAINFYDSSKNFISAINDIGAVYKERAVFTYPTNTKYVVFCSNNSHPSVVSSSKTNLLSEIESIRDFLNSGYIFGGVAAPATDPGNPSGKVFYLTAGAGTFTHFTNQDDEPLVFNTAGIRVLYFSPEDDWQYYDLILIDSEPTAGSNNLVKSSSIYSSLANIVKSELNTARENVLLNNIGIVKDGVIDTTNTSFKYSDYIDVDSLVFYVKFYAQSAFSAINFYDSSKNFISAINDIGAVYKERVVFAYPTNTKYVVFCSNNSYPSTVISSSKIDLLSEIESLYTTDTITGTTTVTQINGVANIDKGVKYNIYVKTDDLVANSVKFYVSGNVEIKSITAAEAYAGYSFEYTPAADTILYIRTYAIGDGYTVRLRYNVVKSVLKKQKQQDTINSNNDVTFYNIIRDLLTSVGNPVNFINVGVVKNGVIDTTNTSFSYSDFIDVKDKTIYLKYYAQGAYSPINFYDENRQPIDALNDVGAVYKEKIYNFLPSTVKYVVFCQPNGNPSTDFIGTVQDIMSNTYTQWHNKNVVIYGDSITAQGNGDNPGNTSFMYWAKQYFKFANLYARGIGGQTYKWNTYGWYTAVGTNGKYLNRYNYNAQGQQLSTVVSPLTTTTEDIANIEAHYDTSIEIHYGAFCSWDRIKTMIPESIKNSIDLIIIAGGTNDFSAVEEVEVEGDISAAEPQWIPNDATDPIWAADSTYYKNGDYDITTFAGAIASTVMKMQTWCPNAVVIIATPFPRFNLTTKQQYTNSSGLTFRKMCEIEMEVASMIGTDVIDANGKCGINGVNFESYQLDSVHPNANGRKMYGGVFCGELIRVGKKI